MAGRSNSLPLCDAMDFSDKGLGRGQLVTWNVYSKIANAGGTLTEQTTMPESNYTVQQGTATVSEFGNSIPFTSLVQYYSAQDVSAVVRDVLARDCRETMDTQAHTQFNRCLLRFVGTTTAAGILTTNGTATATNSTAYNTTLHRLLVDTMKERNIPPYRGDDYVAVARPTALRPIRAELQSVFQYTDAGYQKILKGEIGRYDGVRFVEQTQILAGTATNGTAWTSGLSDWIYLMGADTVAEIMAIPPEVRGRIPSDYGRSLGMAWYALEGFGIIYQSGNDASATNSRIIKWDSAS